MLGDRDREREELDRRSVDGDRPITVIRPHTIPFVLERDTYTLTSFLPFIRVKVSFMGGKGGMVHLSMPRQVTIVHSKHNNIMQIFILFLS